MDKNLSLKKGVGMELSLKKRLEEKFVLIHIPKDVAEKMKQSDFSKLVVVEEEYYSYKSKNRSVK
tara:strand:+ start:2400 stop:2594 length:195 start_codon:yes stop_codon:yes gene_type:complete